MKIKNSIIKERLKTYYFKYILLILTLIVSEIADVVLYYSLGKYLNLFDKFNNAYINVLYFLTTLLFIKFIASFFNKHLDFFISNRLLIDVESIYLNVLLKSKYEFIQNKNKIEIAQQINNDVVTISDFYTSKIPLFMVNVLKSFIIYYFVIKMSILSSLILIALSTLYALILFLTKKDYERKSLEMLKKQMEYFGVLGGELLDVFNVKANSWYNLSIERFLNVGNEFVKKSVKFLDIDYLITNLISNLTIAITILLPATLLFIGYKSIGNIVALIFLFRLYLNTISQLSEFVKERINKNVSESRLKILCDLPKDENGSKILSEIDTIELENVNFKYKTTDKIILDNYNYKFIKGKVYAILGKNGSGKSTILKLILGILSPSCGCVNINEFNLKDIDSEKLRRDNISYCSQVPYVVDGTIWDNLSYGIDNVSDFPLKNKFLKFINDLQMGFDTFITSKDSNLSGGQKQKIAIARTLSKKAQVYIFDEPTAALDKDSINNFYEIISIVKSNSIVIIVSHDDEIKEVADEIINLS